MNLLILASVGNHVEKVLWPVRDTAFLPRLKSVVILCGTNNINNDIVQGLIAIGSSFKNRCNNPNIFICGLLPRDKYVSLNTVIIDEINDLLSFILLIKVRGGHWIMVHWIFCYFIGMVCI